ncbi:carbohydrate ABC transporter permease [Paenibacillus psychroresistens]|uniref:Carbohydrate ABC transporter permease n=1 Tax=Paenibacillus psychroresistens TaxID=1778678 RepID=A0A6B8RVW8_9BACL|nr:carbohydrate ABC transporter permease [Paenibacillus psychroresistens]QGR00043.1 carbohydrate ABC transporter permease [Paenibacillus psychroresistens]
MKRETKLTKFVIYFILIVGSFMCLFPLYWIVRSSLMEMAQIFVTPPIWFPKPFAFSNYVDALTAIPFFKFFVNTMIIVVSVVAGSVLAASICAYSFARMNWTGRKLFFILILSSMMMPHAVTMIPTFIGWSKIGATNSFIPLALPIWFGGGAFNIFLLRQFFMSIPKELDEAAFVDGASYFRIYSTIILPLSKSALIVVGLFAFLGSWNDFMGPLIYLNDESKFTLSLGLQLFKGMYSAQWHLMMAATAVVLAPTLIVFFIGQKYIIEGISMTGIKG